MSDRLGEKARANFSPARQQYKHLEATRAPQSNFFGGTFLSPKTSMMQTKTNEYKQIAIQGFAKRDGGNSTTTVKKVVS